MKEKITIKLINYNNYGKEISCETISCTREEYKFLEDARDEMQQLTKIVIV